MTMTTYTIKRRDEETECSDCAYPLFIDDKAYMSKDEKSVYCSKTCHDRAERNEAPLVKPQPKGVRVGCFDV